jgi:hypothetical protein
MITGDSFSLGKIKPKMIGRRFWEEGSSHLSGCNDLPIDIALFGLEFVVIDESGHGPGGTFQIWISRNAGGDEIQA